jgi:drug/metabolite transporter (DMT)-like permease
MVYLLGLLAALAFALGSVLQQKGTLDVPAAEGDPHFLAQIIRYPLWWCGAGCQGAGWILQAVALDKGPLVVVQSLTTMSLVIALPLGVRFTKQQVSVRVWLGALATVAGVVLLLSVGSPQAGTSRPSAADWWSAGIASAVLVTALAGDARRRRGATRALLLGSAAGVGYALQASVTKEFVGLVGQGLGAILTSWTIWVLIVSALSGFVFQQSALKTGVLAPAIAASNAVTLFVSVIFGVTIFGESLSNGSGRSLPAIAGLVIALVGIVFLAGAQPPSPADVDSTAQTTDDDLDGARDRSRRTH